MSRALRQAITIVLLVASLGTASTTLALPPDRGAAERPGPTDWLLSAWNDLVALVEGVSVGPGSDPDGLTSGDAEYPAREGENDGDVGPGLDPNG